MKRFARPDENTVASAKKKNQMAINPDTFQPVYPYNVPPLSIQAPFFNSSKGLTQSPPGFLAAKLKPPLTFASDGSIAFTSVPITEVDTNKGLDKDLSGRVYIKSLSPLSFNSNGELTVTLPPPPSIHVDKSGGLKDTADGLSIFLSPTSGLQTNSNGLFLFAETIWTGPIVYNISGNSQVGIFFSITQMGGIAHCLVALTGRTSTLQNMLQVLFKFDQEGNLMATSDYTGKFGKRTSSLGIEENNKKENWSIFMPSKALHSHTRLTQYCTAPISIIQKPPGDNTDNKVSNSNITVVLNGDSTSAYSIKFHFNFKTPVVGEFKTTFGSFSYLTELPGTNISQ